MGFISGWWLSPTPLKSMMEWVTVGMMTFPTEWKNVPKHQPVVWIYGVVRQASESTYLIHEINNHHMDISKEPLAEFPASPRSQWGSSNDWYILIPLLRTEITEIITFGSYQPFKRQLEKVSGPTHHSFQMAPSTSRCQCACCATVRALDDVKCSRIKVWTMDYIDLHLRGPHRLWFNLDLDAENCFFRCKPERSINI